MAQKTGLKKNSIIISDASPLIALALVGGLPWLYQLFGTVTLTSVVQKEVISGQGLPGEIEIEHAIKRKWLKVIEDIWTEPHFPELDEGEASILRAATNLKKSTLLILDEQLGRTLARELNFKVIGTVGIILAAKIHGLIPSVKPVLDQLLKNDFRLSAELIRAVLTEANEN